MRGNTVRRLLVVLLSFAMVLQTISFQPFLDSTASAEYDTADGEVVIGTFYNYSDRLIQNRSDIGLYCDWTVIDGGKTLDMTKNGIDEGAYLHLTIRLDAVRNGQHVSGFTVGGYSIRLRSLDNNGENAMGWNGITLKEGVNQIDIPLYSTRSAYTGTAYANTTGAGTMNWAELNRLIVASYDANKYYGTDTSVSMTISNACITCPADKRDSSGFENVRIAAPTLASEDKIVYSVNAVTDMGADNTGNNDSTAAIQNAINAVKGSGGIVFLPAGFYRVDGTLNIPAGVTLRGEWKNPDEGGLGKGTILKAYYGAGDADAKAFMTIASGSCIRDLSVWYPNQNAASPVAYPYTIEGSGHTSIYNITLYNSYNGFKNNSCSSMLIRGLYGTVLNYGIWAAYAYDVPRTEQISFDTAYWAGSGLTGAPAGETLNTLNTYCENNTFGILSGEQDWGYWYDIYVNHAKYACYLTSTVDNYGSKLAPGNDAIGNLRTENVQYGIYIHSTSYPGLEVTYSDIDADVAGICYAPKPANTDYIGNESGTVNAAYYPDSSIIITKTDFSGNGYGYLGLNDAGKKSAANFNDCTFENWNEAAIYMTEGNLVCSNGVFQQKGTAIKLDSNMVQAVLSGNKFASPNAVVYDDSATAMDMTDEQLVPNTPDYEYGFAPSYNPAANNIFNVEAYGAVAGVIDSTSAFQQALNAAGNAGGGTVYVPGGYYTLKGSLTVPSGVELRGSFDGAHYGNSTSNGTVLYVYANKDNPKGAPFITLGENAGVRGFTIVYPEQGITDDASLDEPVHEYPATIRMNKGSWVRTCSINAAWTMIDAMTNVCDGFVLNDVTGCYMGYGLLLGHGTDGGYIQDFHSNYTSWPNNYLHAHNNKVDKTIYTTKNSTWMILGDFSNIKFFSDFTILISTGMQLITDPYTGKCTQDMTAWGIAFDATGDGIVGEAGADSQVTLLSTMGVYNQHEPGYNVVTKEGFNGTVNLYNADVWSPSSRLVNVAGGTVNLIQYLSWCCYNGVCHEGGTANIYGSTFVGADTGSNNAVTYESGSSGTLAGNNNNRGNFNTVVKVGATDVTLKNNGLTKTMDSDIAVDFNKELPAVFSDRNGMITSGWKPLTPLKLSSGATQNHAGLGGYNYDDLYMKITLSIDKGSNTAADENIFKNGTISLRQAWSAGDGSDDALCYTLNDGYFYAESGSEYTLFMPMAEAVSNNASFNWNGVKFINITLDASGYTGISMTVSDARIVDKSVAEHWKYELYQAIAKGPDVKTADTNIYSDYIPVANAALAVYYDETASMDEIISMIDTVNAAVEGLDDYYLDRTGWSATASHNNAQINLAFDGRLDTRWTTFAVQEPGQWLVVDLGKAMDFDVVEMALATSTKDMPAGYEIYVSQDGENWGEPVRTGSEAIEEYYVGSQYARYIKIVQTGNKYLYWSIHEFNLKNVGNNVTVDNSGITEDTLKLIGRTYYENEELKLAWTGSGFSFNINGTGAAAVISTTNTHELLKGYLNVYVDGALVPTNTVCVTENGATYVLAEGLPYGRHTITVRKRNEAGYGGNATLGFSKITVTGGSFLAPPEKSEKSIGFIGDSITSGFGNMVDDGQGDYNSSNTEGTMTYAALTGNAFGAETYITSRSGIRFVRTTTGESMLDYYLPTSGLTGNNTPWNFDRGSDVVVINLGTNDNGARDSEGNLVTDEYVQSEAVEMLKMVRSVNPDAIIIWAYGIMGSGRADAIKAAVESMNDSKIYFLPLDVLNKATEGSGVGNHPTITAGINRSFDLVEFIAEKTGWDYDYDVQLATQLYAYSKYETADLSEYTDDSVNNLKNAISHAKALSSDSSNAAVKAEVKSLQDAVNGLQTKLEAAPALDRTGWRASASHNNNGAGNALDGNISTRWSTIASQAAGQWFMIDMGQLVTFDVVELLLGTSMNDGPAGYEIYVSADGLNWGTPIISGSDSAEQYYVGVQTARYVKVVQTKAKGNYWSIHEFNLKYSADTYDVSYYDGSVKVAAFTYANGTVPTELYAALEEDGKIFAGWYTEEVTLDSAASIKAAASKAAKLSDISGNTVFYAGWIEIGKSNNTSFELLGTQIRTNNDMGLRFITKIGTGLLAEVEALNSENDLQPDSLSDKGIGYGTVATVASNIGDGMIVKNVNANTVVSGMTVVPAVKYFVKTNDYYQYTCVVRGIGVSNYETEIAARPYITYKDANGREQTYYYTEPGSNAGGGYKVSLYRAAKAIYANSSVDNATKEWINKNIISIVEK